MIIVRSIGLCNPFSVNSIGLFERFIKVLYLQKLFYAASHADLLRLVFTVGERKIALKEIKNLFKNGGLSETMKKFVTTAYDR